MGVTNQSPADQPRGPRPAAIGGLRRADRFPRRVACAWRRLIASAGGGGHGAKTLVACSGGADSTALLLALALSTRELVVGHVLHDLRPRTEAEADRDAARGLAVRLGLAFAEAEVRVAARPGNKEGLARRERYAALARMAATSGCGFVAAAHHADDQLETMLMALLRGAGPHGLRGIAPSRLVAAGPPRVVLIRPMLGCLRSEARAACEKAGIPWREDATNADRSRRRAALRQGVLPLLMGLAPEGARRAAHAAELLRDAARLIDDRVEQAFGERLEWERAALRPLPALVLGLGIRRAALRLAGGMRADRLTSHALGPVIRAIRDRSTDPREFSLAGAVVRVEANSVRIRSRA